MHPLTAWVWERESIRKKKEAGQSPPLTADPILSKYRFCNAYRELDAVTVWIRENWRIPHHYLPDLWFAMVVARHVNLPETLTAIGFDKVLPWDPEWFKAVMANRQAAGIKNYNGAYMIRAGRTGPKHDYLADQVLTPLWDKRDELRPRLTDTLETFHARLQAQFGLGSFMAAQVVADTKYSKPLLEAADWWEFAASGPGSRRGLNRVMHLPPSDPWTEEQWRASLAKLRKRLEPEWKSLGMTWCHAQDTQNQLCEFDKYERTRLGFGRPKRRYP